MAAQGLISSAHLHVRSILRFRLSHLIIHAISFSPNRKTVLAFAIMMIADWIEAGPAPAETAAVSTLVVSISPFPYALTPEAVETVSRLIRDHATLSTVQLDNGIPWEAALNGSPFDRAVMELWQRHKEGSGSHPVYLAIAPLAEDRSSWAPEAGNRPAPDWVKDEPRDITKLKKAYTQYVLRAIEYFHPIYLNIGVEAGDMAERKPGKWPLFEALYHECATNVRARFPSVKLGISFSLPLLMQRGVLARVANVIGQSDYIGISFYPYLSDFYAQLGGVRLPAPPQQWREPLTWLAEHAKKPVAICETGYSTKPVVLSRYGLDMKGDEAWQNQYVSELAEQARRDHYLFTVFFLAVDCDALMKQLKTGDDGGLWTHTGFFDEHLRQKPAWESYLKTWLGSNSSAVTLNASNPPVTEDQRTSASPLGSELGFKFAADLFTAPAPDKLVLAAGPGEEQCMRWEYAFRPHEFSWAVKAVKRGSASFSRGLAFDLRSDREDTLLLKVDLAGGEAFFTLLHPAKNWTHQEMLWSAFAPEAKKNPSGPLRPEQIIRILMADPSAVDRNLTGRRTVEISNLRWVMRDQHENN